MQYNSIMQGPWIDNRLLFIRSYGKQWDMFDTFEQQKGIMN